MYGLRALGMPPMDGTEPPCSEEILRNLEETVSGLEQRLASERSGFLKMKLQSQIAALKETYNRHRKPLDMVAREKHVVQVHMSRGGAATSSKKLCISNVVEGKIKPEDCVEAFVTNCRNTVLEYFECQNSLVLENLRDCTVCCLARQIRVTNCFRIKLSCFSYSGVFLQDSSDIEISEHKHPEIDRSLNKFDHNPLLMERCFSIDFYLKCEYDRKIDEVAETQYPNASVPDSLLCTILELEDPIISLYLLSKLESKVGMLGNEILRKLRVCIRSFQKIHKYEDSKDLEDKVLHIICSRVGSDTDINVFIECISELDIRAPALKFVKETYGYGQIYRYSKNVLNNILSKKYNEREIGYALVLLNHPRLCYKHLLPLLKRINLYIDSMMIEKNIVRACAGLRAVALYSPETLKNSGTFVLSLIVFLAKIFCQPSLYTCMECGELRELLQTLELLATMDADAPEGGSNVFCSILEDASRRLECVAKERSSIVEDSMMIYGLAGVCRVAYKMLFVEERDVCNRIADGLVGCICTLRLERQDYVPAEVWLDLLGLFLKEKYGLLELASRSCQGFSLDMGSLIQDIRSSSACLAVWFVEIDHLYCHFDWKVVLESIASPSIKCHLGLVEFVLSERHAGQRDYREHITKYLGFLLQLESMNTLLLAVIRSCNMIRVFDTRSVIAMLVRLFLRDDFQAADRRILKMKKKIISTALQEGLEVVFLEEIFGAAGCGRAACNPHILTFLVVFFCRAVKMPEGTVERALELLCGASHFPEWSGETCKDRRLVVRCIAMGVILSKYDGGVFAFLKRFLHTSSFYLYAIFFISQLHLKKLDYRGFSECEGDLVEFLFAATDLERMELEKLYFFLKEQPGESLESSVFVKTYKALFCG
ncbi:UNVERIFIED_CONTAM: hypothetical protein PYX00_011279 [Menopon gallinae]|uniref:C-CAP/cofactor C-like domain-containing protein n=1 Tax=Menopon gallinae TaxID=328185 RepID=A0AAW2H782_9NEOP